MNFEDIAKKWALFCKVKYDKIDLNSVVSKVVAEIPEIKKDIKKYIPKIKEIVEKINIIDKEKAKIILENEFPEILAAKKEEKKDKIDYLEEAEYGKVKTRFAPNPSGYLHIGHAKAIVLSYYFAKKYNGKFILRLEDTDPKVKKPLIEAYEKIIHDVEWLIEDKIDEIYIQSERLNIYYTYAKKLIELGYAYVDLCNSEKIKDNRKKGIACEHRSKDIDWNLEQFKKMLDGEYDEGQAVLRIKTDINHPNPSIRDWIAFRVINPEKNPHPWLLYKYGENYAKKFWVWPTYNFSVSIDDHLMEITHVFRMKEHEVNTYKQKYIFDYFGWKMPKIINYGAFLVKDVPLHKSEIRKLINEGKIDGWDYPFLATLMALRRRGIQPKAIKKYVLEIGISLVDSYIDWERIHSYNREIIDSFSKRFFIIRNPIKVIIRNIKIPKEVILKNHPKEDLGERKIIIKSNIFYLEKSDVLNNKYLRLMDAFNIEVEKIEEDKAICKYISDSLEDAKKINAKIVQWVSEEDSINIKILEPSGIINAIGESNLKFVNDGEIIHAIRYGFLKKEKDKFIFMHK
ncbi:MAG: glutamate--tRNA ligase [Nanopusillaceae archaeon]